MMRPHPFAARPFLGRAFSACLVLALLLALSACVNRAGSKAPANPNDKQTAYGATLNVPPSWEVAIIMPPERMSKEALEQKRLAGERVLLLAAVGAPSSGGQESTFSVFLVNEANTFLPRSFAEKLQPQEFAALSRELLTLEKDTIKKNKLPINILDLQVARETVNGNFTVSRKSTLASAQGQPLRSLRWDVYLAGGAGITILAECDAEQPGAEQQIQAMAYSLRLQ